MTDKTESQGEMNTKTSGRRQNVNALVKKAKKQADRKSVVKQLDKVFSEYIRERDKYVCCTCGAKGSRADGVMQCGHLFSRVNYSTRWDEKNAHCQCAGCNLSHEHNSAPYTLYFIHRYGLQEYETLYAIHRQVVKFTTADLKFLVEHYRGEMKKLQA